MTKESFDQNQLIDIMYRRLIIFILLLNEINGDCIYPQWKTTCQKYCMDHQLYEIQLNQCYSMDPKQLTCKCSGQILTEKIQNMIETKTSNPSSLVTNSTVLTTIAANITCIPSHSCIIGKMICNGVDDYCKCDNGTWINSSCPKGKICKALDTTIACQTSSSIDEHVSLSTTSYGVAPSMKINQYVHIFIFYLLIFKNKI